MSKKVVLTIDDVNNLLDGNGNFIMCVTGINYNLPELKEKEEGENVIDGEQLIRLMKMSAYISQPDKVAKL